MTTRSNYLTQDGYDKLMDELKTLRTTGRDEVAERLHKAVEEAGSDNLSEDAEYEAAKNAQAFIEGRIRHLELLLANARIIQNGSRDTVEVGAMVTIQEEDYDPEVYTIVGAEEADPRKGLISNVSPLGKALLDHKAGDEVSVLAPSGSFKVKILEVK